MSICNSSRHKSLSPCLIRVGAREFGGNFCTVNWAFYGGILWDRLEISNLANEIILSHQYSLAIPLVGAWLHRTINFDEVRSPSPLDNCTRHNRSAMD